MLYHIYYSCVCHRGKVRNINQDNIVCDCKCLPPGHDDILLQDQRTITPEEPFLVAVFDGMGGESHGEMASWIAADTFHNWDLQRGEQSLIEGCLEGNRRIVRFGKKQRLKTCGTTAAMLLFDYAGIIQCNIGNSRIYRIRDKELQLLSETDVYPAGRRRKTFLLQYLGIPEEEMLVQPHTLRYPAENGDIFLVCSDGLTDMVTERNIVTIIRSSGLDMAGEALLQNAMNAGSMDNITFFLAQVRKDG